MQTDEAACRKGLDTDEPAQTAPRPDEPIVVHMTDRRTRMLRRAAFLPLLWLFLGCYRLWAELPSLTAAWAAQMSGGASVFSILSFLRSPSVVPPSLLGSLLMIFGAFLAAGAYVWTIFCGLGFGDLLLYEDWLVWQGWHWSRCVYFSGREKARRRQGRVVLSYEGGRIIIPHGLYSRPEFARMHALLVERCAPYRECLTVRFPLELRLFTIPEAVVAALISLPILALALPIRWSVGDLFISVLADAVIVVAAAVAWPGKVLFRASDISIHRFGRRRRYDVRSLRGISSYSRRLYLQFGEGYEIGVSQLGYPVALLEKQLRDLYKDIPGATTEASPNASDPFSVAPRADT